MTNVPGTNIASVGVDIAYDTSVLGSPSAIIGPAGTAAGKDVSTSITSPGVFRVGILGLNANVIGDGVVAYVSFTIDPVAAFGSTTLSNTPSASDPDGNLVTVGGSNCSVTVRETCKTGDCDGNDTVTIAEVQACINMYLGINPVLQCVDMDNSGIVVIAEVQKCINEYLEITVGP